MFNDPPDHTRLRGPMNDIARQENRHLTFGFGIHFCLGAPLARLEAQIAFPILLGRLREIGLAGHPTGATRSSCAG